MNSKILRIGHRGAMGHVAENTIESIKKAIEFGVDGIEIDVHQCKSGELVVFHDFTLDRMTNGVGEISKQSLLEIKKYEVSGKYQIPTLEEVLDVIDQKCLLNIELKGKDTALKTAKIIQFYIDNKDWDYQDFLVSSFQHKELEIIDRINKNINLAVLTKASVSEAIEFAKTINAQAIHPNLGIITNENIKEAQEKGFQINVWTVNDFEAIARMKKYGVNGIITDFPDRL